MHPLKPGEEFPPFEVAIVDGRRISVPTDLEGEFAILLFYRAWW